MPKIYLNVPYAQKDKAKEHGAKWDAEKKSWFIPEGVSPDNFSQWLSEKEKLPTIITFLQHADGMFAARRDNLEIRYEPYNFAWTIAVIGINEDGEEEDEEVHTAWSDQTDPAHSEHAEVKKKVRDMLANGHDSMGHKVRFPQPAAAEFATAVWKFEK